MMAPAGSKGDVVPVSTTKPIFLLVLFHVTVVPAVTQKSLLLLAFGILGVEEAPLAVRLTSTSQGVEADPHVLLASQSCAGFGSVHAYLLAFLDCAVAKPAVNAIANTPKVHLIGKNRLLVTRHLTSAFTPFRELLMSLSKVDRNHGQGPRPSD